MQDKLKPALIGGVGLGVASAIPIVNFVNCACCAWVIAGGVVAAYFYNQQPGPKATPPWGDAVLLGLLTGAIGAAAGTIVGIPFMFLNFGSSMANLDQLEGMMGDQEIPPVLQNLIESTASGGFSCLAVVIGFFFSLVIYSIFATVGSLIGTAIFQPKNQTA